MDLLILVFSFEYFYYFYLIGSFQFAGIKNYIVGLIIKTSSNPELLESEKVFIGKLNIILVQVRDTILPPEDEWTCVCMDER